MSANAFQLHLTQKGSETINNLLLENTSDQKLQMAFGDGTRPFSKADTRLEKEQFRTFVSWAGLVPNKNKTGSVLHINATLPKNTPHFNITEFGLLLTSTDSNPSVLIARYVQEQTIATKTADIEILLDTMIQIHDLQLDKIIELSKDYKPQFSEVQASDRNYGTVKFADEKALHKIDSELALSPELALSSNILKFKGIFPKTMLRNHWERVVDIKMTLTLPYKFSAILHTPDEKIYCLFIGIDNNNLSYSKNIYLLKYNLKEKEKEPSFHSIILTDFIAIDSIHPYYFETKEEKEEIRCLVLKKPGVSNSIFFLKITKLLNKTYKGEFGETIGAASPHNTGSLIALNDTYLSVGGLSKYSNELFMYSDEYNKNYLNKLLKIPRKKPLVFAIQGKLYCIGGEENANSTLEIHQLLYENNKPELKSLSYLTKFKLSLDLNDTDKFCACVLNEKIYIFQLNTKKIHIYNYLSNHWSLLEISTQLPDELDESNCQCITVDDSILLVSLSFDKTKLSVFKFTPL